MPALRRTRTSQAFGYTTPASHRTYPCKSLLPAVCARVIVVSRASHVAAIAKALVLIGASYDESRLQHCSMVKRTGGQTKRTVKESGQLADVGILVLLLRVENRLRRCSSSSDCGACT